MPMPMQNFAPFLSMLSAGGGVNAASDRPLNPWANSLALANGGAMGGGGGALGGINWDDLMRMLSMGGMGGSPFARTPANSAGNFSMPGAPGSGMGTAPLQSIMAARQSPMSGYINRMMQYR